MIIDDVLGTKETESQTRLKPFLPEFHFDLQHKNVLSMGQLGRENILKPLQNVLKTESF